jgi:hypothetical protein
LSDSLCPPLGALCSWLVSAVSAGALTWARLELSTIVMKLNIMWWLTEMWQLPPRRQLPHSCLNPASKYCPSHASILPPNTAPVMPQYCPFTASFRKGNSKASALEIKLIWSMNIKAEVLLRMGQKMCRLRVWHTCEKCAQPMHMLLNSAQISWSLARNWEGQGTTLERHKWSQVGSLEDGSEAISMLS